MNSIREFLFITILIFCSNIINSQNKGTVIHEFIASDNTKKNIYGDTASPKVIIYLPPSYNNSGTNYPVLYYLTGSFAEVDQMFDGSIPNKMNEYLDSLIHARIIREMIVVVASSLMNIPGAVTRMPTAFINSPINGNWEDYIIDDLIPHIDSTYRTNSSPIARGICGHSLGGYSTIRLALLHPDMFGYAYSMSFGMSNTSLYLGPVDLEMNEKNLYRIKNLYNLKVQSEGTTYEGGISLFNKMAEDNRMIWPLALGTIFAPRQDLKPPFFYIPLTTFNDSIVIDTSQLSNYIFNPDMCIDSLINRYINKENKRLTDIVLEVGLYDGESFKEGCNYTSLLFMKNKIPHQVVYTNFAHVNKLRYRMINYTLPYFSRHLGKERGENLYNP